MSRPAGPGTLPAAADGRAPTSAAVIARPNGSSVTVAIVGVLDEVAGTALLDTIRTELDRAPERIDVDLDGVTRWTDDGLARLTASRSMAGRLPAGLHFRTAGGRGQEALLEAFRMA